MASSSRTGKAWSKDRILALQPKTVLDIGPGRGTYFELLEPTLHAMWVGVEVWGPYVERYKLRSTYHRIVVGDVRYLDLDRVMPEQCDLAILGDVLEHVHRHEAIELWIRLRRKARWILLSLPVDGLSEQGTVWGNQYETHLTQWTTAECLRLPGVVDHFVKKLASDLTPMGCFLAEGTGAFVRTAAAERAGVR